MRSHLFKIISFPIFVLFVFSSCKKEEAEDPVKTELTPYTLSYPSYFPVLQIPSDNPLTVEGVNLGKKLYYDPILSNTGQSCSSCHSQAESFSLSSANSLPHLNLGWNTAFLWNGKVEGSMEDIMKFEVEQFFQTNISNLNANQYYKDEFKKVYGVTTITAKEVEYALAQFFRVMISSNSKFDKFAQHQVNLTPSEFNGLQIFTTEKGDCFHCHSLGLFSDNKFHNIGIDSTFSGVNMGRYNITGDANDIGLFKTPTLRNIELTAPYMHDGRFQTLQEVVDHYDMHVKVSPTVDPIMTKASKAYGLGLTPQEKTDLINFLKTLTDTVYINYPALHP